MDKVVADQIPVKIRDYVKSVLGKKLSKYSIDEGMYDLSRKTWHEDDVQAWESFNIKTWEHGPIPADGLDDDSVVVYTGTYPPRCIIHVKPNQKFLVKG